MATSDVRTMSRNQWFGSDALLWLMWKLVMQENVCLYVHRAWFMDHMQPGLIYFAINATYNSQMCLLKCGSL